MAQQLIFTSQPRETLIKLIEGRHAVVITDTNCRTLVVEPMHLPWPVIEIPAGEEHKTITTVSDVWRGMIEAGCTRRSVVINIGGGVVTDLGGFAAATFKRGIDFINVPTTVLGAVDAAVGGKTGVDFMGLKNEVGVFRPAIAVVTDAALFSTLPRREWLSGYAEMVKHGLLTSTTDFRRLIAIDLLDEDTSELSHLPEFASLLRDSVSLKARITEADPCEKGIRRNLNLGHTVGHAIETLMLERNAAVPHGFAVAWGLVAACVLSRLRLGFPSDDLHILATFVRSHYGTIPVSCDDYPRLLELMSHDKKNPSPDRITFTLLHTPGHAEAGLTATPDEITAALDIARDIC